MVEILIKNNYQGNCADNKLHLLRIGLKVRDKIQISSKLAEKLFSYLILF